MDIENAKEGTIQKVELEKEGLIILYAKFRIIIQWISKLNCICFSLTKKYSNKNVGVARI